MDLGDTGFDRYQRFSHAAELIDGLARGRGLSILELGSWDEAFAPFAPGHRVTAYGEMVLEGAPIRAGDQSYDLALALDVLEHVPPGERRFFISELGRVAKQAVVIGFPVKQAQKTEEFVLELTNSPWLREHQEHGLPKPEEVEALFAELGFAFQRHPNAALPSWCAMMLLMYGAEPSLRQRISRFFNREFYHLENREPAYRYIYVLRRKR